MNGNVITKPPVLHFEDDEDWQEIVEEIIRESTNLDYDHIASPIVDIFGRLDAMSGPAIAIFDLRLEGPHTEYHTIVELAGILQMLHNKHIEVFILSGYLPEIARPLLLHYGIPEGYIFNKGLEFSKNRSRFIREIKKTEEHLSKVCEAKNLELEDKIEDRNEKLFEIIAKFGDPNESEESIMFEPDKEYNLELIVNALPGLQTFYPLYGNHLDIFIFAIGANITPNPISLRLPKPGNSATETSIAVFRHLKGHKRRKLNILIYHNNHLMRVMKLPLREI